MRFLECFTQNQVMEDLACHVEDSFNGSWATIEGLYFGRSILVSVSQG